MDTNPTAMPETATPPAYDSWADYYDIGEGDRTPYLHFYRGLLSGSTRSVLEIGCGTGVIASALARDIASASADPSRVAGVDNSAPMLRIASARDPSVEWHLGDMRALPVQGQFDLVFCCFNTFQFMLSDEDLEQAFREAQARTSAGGRFAFDLYQPNIPYISRARNDDLARSIQYQGRALQIREDSVYEPGQRILELNWRLVDASNGGQVLASTRFRIRQYFPTDIERLLSRAGFRVEQRFGDLDRSAFTAQSRKQVLVCAPR